MNSCRFAGKEFGNRLLKVINVIERSRKMVGSSVTKADKFPVPELFNACSKVIWRKVDKYLWFVNSVLKLKSQTPEGKIVYRT